MDNRISSSEIESMKEYLYRYFGSEIADNIEITTYVRSLRLACEGAVKPVHQTTCNDKQNSKSIGLT